MRGLVGLIPAAGIARRLGGLSQSKEILPVVFGSNRTEYSVTAKPVCTHLLGGLSRAGVTKAFIVLRTGKWDVPETLAKYPATGLDLSYILIDESAGVPWTLDRAYKFVSGSNVVMGFPDVLVRPPTFYRQLVDELRAGRSDVVLGVMPTTNPGKVDVVEIADNGKVHSIRPKPDDLSAAKAWIAAAWRPSFSDYLHDYLVNSPARSSTDREIQIGDILAASLNDLDVRAVEFEDGHFIDIGTPEDLARVTPGSQNF